ncbi:MULTISPECIES: prepilin-type N-terminal cleavage/methylation domain-containing protein [unclassified Exiguobacterium]|uniref:type IV pilus modification PilV family protein n=1 Tax=unclassified Exiguobacterium TaxID=2644629 RepID=UPI000B596A62|nr:MULTISPECIES: prepilin-type N-terminal cleavage/methylation domain-containing protein [unclassified Exiguobacterium]ASI35980.1 prepilin-type cleavage/methylation domain-containing protein [Exiguobacterium sp. N4-1P]
MQNKQQGFSLIEVLVSITILSIISVSLISIFSQSLSASRDSTELTFANYLAKNAASYIEREAVEAENGPFVFDTLLEQTKGTPYQNGSYTIPTPNTPSCGVSAICDSIFNDAEINNMPFDVKISVTPHKIEGIENPNLLDLYVYVYLDGQAEPITSLKGSITNATLNQSFPATK